MKYQKTPTISVGIMFEQEIKFTLNGEFKGPKGNSISGTWKVALEHEDIYLSSPDSGSFQLEHGMVFIPLDAENSSFKLHDVTIGIGFHWERKEDQEFKGGLKFIVENHKITAINVLSVEDYLISVNSSEMSATSSAELLKAHAVISRSWLLAQIEKNKKISDDASGYESLIDTKDEHIKWYDREDHQYFDVCADDHCQRYQGITRASTKLVEEAINETYGEALTYGNKICDARFSKCCGGMMETFENAWEPVNHPYLQKKIDNDHNPAGYKLDLENEPSAQSWIKGNPDAFCNTDDALVLSQVLNDYDQETNDFFRWQVKYGQEEIGPLIKERIGLDFGLVLDFQPIERGASGRLIKLRIVGSKLTKIIGKELEIRKALSKSHLYSSAIVIEKEEENGKTNFMIRGAGWGHGVGLCQIGAAVMGDRGYSYRKILQHYFVNSELKSLYTP